VVQPSGRLDRVRVAGFGGALGLRQTFPTRVAVLLREPVSELLDARMRIAQETLGLRALRADPALLTQACPSGLV